MADVRREALDAGRVAALRLNGIRWALLAGATLFVGVAVAIPWLAGEPGAERGPQPDVVRMLSLVNALLVGSSIFVALIVPARMPSDTPQAKTTRHIVRWAVLEGAALFGAVVVLLAGLAGVLPGEPLYYANLVGYLVFVAVLVGDQVDV